MLQLWKSLQDQAAAAGADAPDAAEDSQSCGTSLGGPSVGSAVAAPQGAAASTSRLTPDPSTSTSDTGKKRKNPKELTDYPNKSAKRAQDDGPTRALEPSAAETYPNELIVSYAPAPLEISHYLAYPIPNDLPTDVRTARFAKASSYILSELGPYARNIHWGTRVRSAMPKLGRDHEIRANEQTKTILQKWGSGTPFAFPSPTKKWISPKVEKLIGILKMYKVQQAPFRGVIFVSKRAIALALFDMLTRLRDRLRFLRFQFLNGKDCTAAHETLSEFASGKFNLLIATEYCEDLDFPALTVLIRFNPVCSQLSYAYARKLVSSGGYLIHMAEAGNDAHKHILVKYSHQSEQLHKWSKEFASRSGNVVPPRCLCDDNEAYLEDSEDEEDPSIQDPVTGRRIYVQDATRLAYRFAALQTADPENNIDHSLFEFQSSHVAADSYTCTVHLPSGSPVPSILGPACRTMVEARRQACYSTCRQLLDLGLLDYRLFPFRGVTVPEIPAELKKRLAAATSGAYNDSRAYPRKQPFFWQGSLAQSPWRLYPTVVHAESLDASPGAPVLFLTRSPLPGLDDFRLFVFGTPATVSLSRYAPFNVDGHQMEALHRYTIRTLRMAMNKPFVCDLGEMLYFVAPLDAAWTASGGDEDTKWLSIEDHIDWHGVHLAGRHFAVPLQLDRLLEDMDDAVIQDKQLEFGRRYYVDCVRNDLNPMSKPDAESREEKFANYVEYLQANSKTYTTLDDFQQPLLEVEVVPSSLNFLNPNTPPFQDNRPPARYLIPERCLKCTIPASVIRTLVLLPSITRKIDDMLLVKEANAYLFNHTILDRHLHAALSPPSAGVEYDYERLELFGDAYLKYLSSAHLFVAFPEREGTLHKAREKIVSNRALLRNADRAGIAQFVQAKPFAFKFWHPPNFTVQGDSADASNKASAGRNNAPQPGSSAAKAADEDVHQVSATGKKQRARGGRADDDVQWLGDKSLADVVEAILGAAYVTGGEEVALAAAKALHIGVPLIDRWSDFAQRALEPPVRKGGRTVQLRPGSAERVEAIIGFNFQRPHLIAQALTRESMHMDDVRAHQRLEFVGDAVLDFLVVRHLFDEEKDFDPGKLTVFKSAMVSNSALAALCVQSGLYKYVHLETPQMKPIIRVYAARLDAALQEEKEAAAKEQRQLGQYWVKVEYPKLLSDVMESIMGAVFASNDFSLKGPEKVFETLFLPFYDRHITFQGIRHHPTKVLFEQFQALGCQRYEIEKRQKGGGAPDGAICDVIVHSIVLATGRDRSTAGAARLASEEALSALVGDPGFMRAVCDCREIAQERKVQKVLDQVLRGFEEEEAAEIRAVEGILLGLADPV